MKYLIVCCLPSSEIAEIVLLEIADKRPLLVPYRKQNVNDIDVYLQYRIGLLREQEPETRLGPETQKPTFS